MKWRRTLRGELIATYVALVTVVTAVGFVTIRLLTPAFFERRVQSRSAGTGGPGSGTGGPGSGTGGSAPGGGTGGGTDGVGGSGSPGSGSGSPGSGSGSPGSGSGSPGSGSGSPGSGSSGPGSGSAGPGGGTGVPGGSPGVGSTGPTGDAGSTGGVGTTGGVGGTGGAGSGGEGFGGAGGAAAAPAAASDPTEVIVEIPTNITDSYDDSLTLALTISAIVGIVLAIILATWITRRILRGLSTMQGATGRLAAGDYEHHIPEPAEAELADLAKSINMLGAELASTERSRGRLVSDLAHELRNPLATIEGYMEGLIDGVLPANTDTYSTIAAEAHRLQRLTADLSLLSQAQEGALNLQLREIDLGAVAQTVADRLRPQFQSKGVGLTVDIFEPLPIAGDADRLTQALINVVGNALTHTPAGGAVAITGGCASGQVHLAVVDSGAGIPPDQLEAMFDRFTRLDANAGGTGIGLNIARTIARHHGGSLTAHSEGPGSGATMTFVIPER